MCGGLQREKVEFISSGSTVEVVMQKFTSLKRKDFAHFLLKYEGKLWCKTPKRFRVRLKLSRGPSREIRFVHLKIDDKMNWTSCDHFLDKIKASDIRRDVIKSSAT